jgi:hypothetical protein
MIKGNIISSYEPEDTALICEQGDSDVPDQ